MNITDEQCQSLMICAKLGHSTTPQVLVSILEDRKELLAAAPTPPQTIQSALNFVCTALPGPGNECAFVELENEAGESLGHGEWRNREDGLVELHIAPPVTDHTFIRGWEVGSRLFRTRKEAHKYICTGQSEVDGNGDSLEPLYRANRADAGVVKRQATPQPIYDEADEQDAFEAVNPMPDQVTKFKGGYAPTGYSAWDAQDFCKKWDGWKQCAQSRAKAGEVGHE